MVAGFTQLVIKDGNGVSQNLEVYQDGSGNLYPAPVGTDALGDILGLAATPIYVFAPVPLFVLPTAGFTRPGDTTAYAFGDLVANSTTAGSVVLDTAPVAKATNQAFTILRCRLQKSTTTLTNAIFRIHLYSVAAPTFTNGDNGAWLSTLASSGTNIYLGSMDVTVDKAGSDVAEGTGTPTLGTAIIGIPISGTQNIAYAVEARAAYAPGNAEVFKCYFEVA